MNINDRTTNEPTAMPMYTVTGCGECDRLKAELAAAREEIAGLLAMRDADSLIIEQAGRDQTRLRALCAARPKDPLDLANRAMWLSAIDAAGRGEGK